MTIADRRDSFCGKMSVCNNLKQYGIPYSLTTPAHRSARIRRVPQRSRTGSPPSAASSTACGSLRIGAIGARPAAFNTVRYSEKILEANGISVEPIDLSEILGRIERMKDDDPAAQAKLAAIKRLRLHQRHPRDALMKMAKLGAVIDDWMKDQRPDHQRRPVLDVDGRILRRRALHRDEHDERTI